MSFGIVPILNNGKAVQLGEPLREEGPFKNIEEAQKRIDELEGNEANGKFTVYNVSP